jgi:DNA polymerase V
MRFLGVISASFPSAAEGYEDVDLNLHEYLVAHPAATHFFRVKGDVLKDESIHDGAILVVDKSLKALRGNLIVTEEHGDFYVRRFVIGTFIVFGVVVGVVKKFQCMP